MPDWYDIITDMEIIALILTILIVFVIVISAIDNNRLIVSRYSLSSEKIKKDCTIAFLSDLHGNTHGNDNQKLIDAVNACAPDIIVMGSRKLRPGKPAPTREEITIEPVEYNCKKLIIATGGLSYPGTGSTGDGYMWAEELGHSVASCYPSLTALVPVGYKESTPLAGEIKQAFRGRTVYGKTKERKIAPLPKWYPQFEKHIERVTPLSDLGELFNGNNLDNVQLTLSVNGQQVQQEFGDIEFTDGGLEGPLGFMVSRKAVKALNDGQKVAVSIDLKPAVELEKLDADVHAKWEEVIHDDRSKGQSFQRLFRIMLGKFIPWNITLAFLKTNPKVSVDSLAATMKDWRLDIAGFVGFERCVITAGGISTAELTAKTLESKKQPGLYFAGEVLDMDCDTGGYNLQMAFATGFLAGQSAAKSLE